LLQSFRLDFFGETPPRLFKTTLKIFAKMVAKDRKKLIGAWPNNVTDAREKTTDKIWLKDGLKIFFKRQSWVGL